MGESTTLLMRRNHRNHDYSATRMAAVMTTRIGIAKSVTCPYEYTIIATDIG